jgi:hypothetical protein
MANLDTFNTALPSGLSTNHEEIALDVMLHTAVTAPYKGSVPVVSSENKNPRVHMDTLPAPVATGTLEGAAQTGGGDLFADVGDYVAQAQEWTAQGSITTWQEAHNSAVDATYEGTISKISKILSRNIEHTLVSDQDKTTDVQGVTAGVTEGLGSFTDPTNTNFAADYRTKTDSVFTGATSAITDAALDALIASIYGEGGEYENLTLLAWPKLRSAIVYNTTRNAGTASKVDYNVDGVGTIPYNVEMMDTAYGKMNMINSNPQTGSESFALGYIYDPKYLSLHQIWGERIYTDLPFDGGKKVLSGSYFASHGCQGANRLGKIDATS